MAGDRHEETPMNHSYRLLAALAAIAVVASPAHADLPRLVDPPPRYQFQTGQELTYKDTWLVKHGQGDNAGSLDEKSEWTVWVLRGNADGSYRLVVRHRGTSVQTIGQTKHEQPQMDFVYADVFPDGRVRPNKTILFRSHPSLLFPPLPKTPAEAKAGWEGARNDARIVCKPLPAPAGFVFEAVTEAPESKIYLSTYAVRYTFDPKRGLIAKAETSSTQGYGVVGSGSGTIELTGAKEIDSLSLRNFVSDADQYFDVIKDYDAQVENAAKTTPADARAMLARAAEKLKANAEAIKQPDLKAVVDERLKQHDQSAKNAVEAAEHRVKVLGQPAPEFETTDLDGSRVRLADLRGQVVVLDFWNRACGWCVKSMPQMNQLAADFARQPVAIFGMNMDKDERDARFVAEKMELRYPTLKAEGLQQRFGVPGIPVLIVIDKQGIVRDVHVGYSPTLRDDVGRTIEHLLLAR
jgi:peroxiredoxin